MQRAPEQIVVDGGYISSNNIAEMAKRGIDFVGPESENKAAEANRRKSYKHHGVSAEYEASKFMDNKPGMFCWNELATRDPDAAKAFYSGLFGWTIEDADIGHMGTYTTYKNGDRRAAGMFKIRTDG